MRIAIDLQSLQSNNRNRGIGRYSYSFTLAFLEACRNKHEVILIINEALAGQGDLVERLLEESSITATLRTWSGLRSTHAGDPANRWRRSATKEIYEAFLSTLNADAYIATSVFEGLGDDAVVSFSTSSARTLFFAIAYDLIPLIHDEIYLPNDTVKNWYYSCLEQLRSASHLLAISGSTKLEILEHLAFSDQDVTNISSAIDSRFARVELAPEALDAVLQRSSITRPFIMYTGGIDHRKNINGLIRAFSKLSPGLRRSHQLVIVCAASEGAIRDLRAIASENGLVPDDVIFTGFVSDDDLVSLYNLCELFVFPSWHEGFGLPVLEAMACGAPVIASNRSSLPEVIGLTEATFDPHDDDSISAQITRALTDSAFRERLLVNAKTRVSRFSWNATANAALASIEDVYLKRLASAEPLSAGSITGAASHRSRRRVAYVSPLPPARSGIADYSADLVSSLHKYYDIEIVLPESQPLSDNWISANLRRRSIEWFKAHAHNYDRIIYHFGNSEHHVFMFELLNDFPGIVVLHDFFLSGALFHLEYICGAKGAWSNALLRSHGWAALRERSCADELLPVIYQYPCNADVIRAAVGIVVHSAESIRLARSWYGPNVGTTWRTVPLLRKPVDVSEEAKLVARHALGYSSTDFVVCSFGFLGKPKLNEQLIQAWAASDLAHDKNCRLIFVGEIPGGEYGQSIKQMVNSAKCTNPIKITGWTDHAQYNKYLCVADMAVQLRTLSRGETSAAVLDCMNYGIPTIVNKNGSMADLPPTCVWSVDDNFAIRDLTCALERLWLDSAKRLEIGTLAKAFIHTQHNPKRSAELYFDAIETFYQADNNRRTAIEKASLSPEIPAQRDLEDFCIHLDLSLPPADSFPPTIWIDVSGIADRKRGSDFAPSTLLRSFVGKLIESAEISKNHVSCIRFGADAHYLSDVELPTEIAGISSDAYVIGEYSSIRKGDTLVLAAPDSGLLAHYQQHLAELRARGVHILAVIDDIAPIVNANRSSLRQRTELYTIIELSNVIGELLCASQESAQRLRQACTFYHGGSPRLSVAVPRSSRLLQPERRHTLGDTPKLRSLTTAFHNAAGDDFILIIDEGHFHYEIEIFLRALDYVWRSEQGVILFIVFLRQPTPRLLRTLECHAERERRLFWTLVDENEFAPHLSLRVRLAVASPFGNIIPSLRNTLGPARVFPIYTAPLHEPSVTLDSACVRTGNQLDMVQLIETRLKCAGAIVGGKANLFLDEVIDHEALALAFSEIAAPRQGKDVQRVHPYVDEHSPVVCRFLASDFRLHTHAGHFVGTSIASNGQSGYLVFGPHITLPRGDYCATIHGVCGPHLSNNAFAEVTAEGGSITLARTYFTDEGTNARCVLAATFFSLDRQFGGLEVRIFVDEFSNICVDSITITSEKPQGTAKIGETTSALLDVGPPGRNRALLALAASHPRFETQAGQRVGECVYTTGRGGVLLHGPYFGIPAGNYRAAFYITGVGMDLSDAIFDVAWNQGSTVIGQVNCADGNAPASKRTAMLIEMPFNTEQYVEDLEFRIFVSERSRFCVERLEIFDAARWPGVMERDGQ